MDIIAHSVSHEIVVGGSSSAGMPQLDPSSYPSQLFWLTVTFFILHFFMAKFIIPRIRGVLEKRQTQIDHDINAAEKAKNDAEKARLSYEKSLADSRAKGNQAIADAQSMIDRMVAEEHSKLDNKLAKNLAKSEEQIAEQTDKATQEMLPYAKELAGLIAKQITDKKPTAKTIDAAVDAVMKG